MGIYIYRSLITLISFKLTLGTLPTPQELSFKDKKHRRCPEGPNHLADGIQRRGH